MATNQGGGLAVTNLVLTFTNLGTMPAYQLTNVSITVRPTVWGILTNSAVCASPTPDPRKLNNSASIKTVVDTLQIGVLRVGDSLVMSWTEAAAGYELETATNVVQTVWAPVTNNIATVNGRNYVVLEIGDGSQFFRLKPPTP
jgi:hypothetical protein